MSKFFGFKRKINGDEILNIEMVLSSVLQPITPRKEFVRTLQTKVLANAYPEGEILEKQAKKNFMLIVLSLMGASLLLGVWIRVIVSILSLIGIVFTNRQELKKRRRIPVQSAA